MKRIIIFFGFLLISLNLRAQIEKVIVETYYISDSLDATDTTDNRVLEAGSKTYRIYIDLKPGSKIKNIYGGKYHKLKIASTASFYNNINRPNAWFGYLINKAWFAGNPTLALDSWLTLGMATKIHAGILKAEDSDGSIVGGSNNGGGSSSVPGGLLVNNNPLAGIPLTTSDGFSASTATFGQWLDLGFKDVANVDTTIFGSVNTGSVYISTDTALLQQNSMVSGANLDSNKVLVAQLTTKGEISFELNLEIQNSDGSVTKYVANDDTLLVGEEVSPFLKYPPACGCQDPNFLEYKKSYSCGISDSCKTRIVFGCLDTMACNYNSAANYNIAFLCCYPGYCNDRDLAVVCPQLNTERQRAQLNLNIHPNPAQEKISIDVSGFNTDEAKYSIYNSYGKIVKESNLIAGNGSLQIDISDLQFGLFFIRVYAGDEIVSASFLKN